MSKDETEPRDVAVQSDSSNGHVESDDALEAVDEEQRGWSAARRMAYSKISQSPDSYYYYYTAPGEMHKHGLWSSHEHAVFMSHFDQPGAWSVPDLLTYSHLHSELLACKKLASCVCPRVSVRSVCTGEPIAF
jgi:hypothetical protein